MRRPAEDDLSLRTALRALPQRQAPAAVWERIQARLEESPAPIAEPPATGLRRSPLPYLAMAAGIAFAAAAAVFFGTNVQQGPEQVRQAAETPFGFEPPAFESQQETSAAALASLVAESARLERTLVSLPRYDGIVRVGTASTIAGLEDHIAWIDAELSASAALDVDPGYRQALWQERVEMMTALIEVQYAQLPAVVLLH